MAFTGDHGHDFGLPNLDGLSFFYIALAIAYSAIIFLSLLVLYWQRATTEVKLRGFGNTCLTVLTLHVYLVLILLAYTLNGLYKCSVEFYIMSVFLPFSMALFQASNMRLLNHFETQKQLASTCHLEARSGKRTVRQSLSLSGLWQRWKEQSSMARTYTIIAGALAMQVALTFILFFASRRFHSSYGLFGENVDAAQCRRGLEWIPSVFWQFLWSTVFGPYILLRIRNIKDSHYWAWQTRLAIIACLPATPLWLIFTYSNSPTVANVNKWFVPAGWFLPSLITMQLSSIIFPLLDVRKKNATLASRQSTTSSSSSLRKSQTREMYSMSSLEMQISKNLDPLLRWACEKDLTAENIVFLRAVRDFRKKWLAAEKRSKKDLSNEQLRERFEDAAYIWFKLVNPLTARFNINIDYRTYSDLETIFVGLRYESWDDDVSAKSVRSENVVTPWADFEGRPPSLKSQGSEECKMSDVDRLYVLPVTEVRMESATDEDDGCVDASVFHIPPAFGIDVFDKAYESVKTDVFHNTWPRYEARFSRPNIHSSTTLGFDDEQAYLCRTPLCKSVKKATSRMLGKVWPAKSPLVGEVV
ncbi:hypothetical protein BT63DRAFT_428530 [Microthyrium microscopicum]|uniref:RGS domain-containing protein n=1 Tax=Microthyrium microscopicum TaxID=703497 RepID=A0A6A6U0Y6_9PEZI|nr:hypothetical protein BT63DRAFT_428530 [Microthyrium microscopicum]